MKKTMHLHRKIAVIFLASVFVSACGGDEDAARIVVGNSSEIISVNGDLQYQKEFVVQVTDTSGAPAPNTSVTVSLRNLKYYKGIYVATGDGWVPTSYPVLVNPLVDPLPAPHECDAEDRNNNGILDVSADVTEDINDNGRLDPTNAATIAAHSTLIPSISAGTNIINTNESGFGYFALVYPKSEGIWSEVEITVSAKVSGTESSAVFNQNLSVALSDVTDEEVSPPGGVEGSYGIVADCTVEN